MKFKFKDVVIINTEFYQGIKGRVIEHIGYETYLDKEGYHTSNKYKVHLADFIDLTWTFDEQDLTLDSDN